MKILCEVSIRHVHLSREHVDVLFGKGYELTVARYLSQPGQFLCAERVNLVTPKAVFQRVGIIGPVRGKTQVELSKTDCFVLGLRDVPIRQSGELDKTPGITLQRGEARVELESGVIVAKRHIHLDNETAKEMNIADGRLVSVIFDGERGGRLDNTVVRVSQDFSPSMHIDSDEANCVGFIKGEAEIIW